MIKPDERVLHSLLAMDKNIVTWLAASLAQFHKDLEEAPAAQVGILQGKAQVLRSILNSASGAHTALERIRS